MTHTASRTHLYPSAASPFMHSLQDLASDVVRMDHAATTTSTPPEPPEPYISTNLISKLDRAILAAWAPNTLEKYRLGVAHFIHFCAEQHIANEFQLPASEFLLCTFAASSAGLCSGLTIRNDISAIHAWHITSNVPYFGNVRLNYTLKGVENLTPESSKHPPRPPITLDMLCILYEDLNLMDPLDTCCWAAAMTAFWGQARLGKLLSKCQSKFIPGSVPTLLNLSHPPRNTDTVKLHLPFTKTKGHRGKTIYLCPQFGPSNPCSALSTHLLTNNVPPDPLLFSYYSTNRFVALTTQKLVACCNSIWSIHGLPSCSGHSFRIGGTTKLLLSNVPPHIVKLLGRWSSDAFLHYWRNLEHIAPMHASFLNPCMHNDI
jgi:hypothetical protein